MKLYVVRHGQSTANLQKFYSGWSQVPLTEEGISDAKRAGKYLQGISFDRVYSSDLIRAVQTAQYALPGCEPIQLPELRERGLGELTGLTFAEAEERFGAEFVENRKNGNYAPYGGESDEEVTARAKAFLKRLEDDPCDMVAAFSHFGYIRKMLEVILGVSLKYSGIRCPNGSIAVFEYSSGSWFLQTWGGGFPENLDGQSERE